MPIHFRDEESYVAVLPKGEGTCRIGYLFWPCFQLKVLVMWDADWQTLNKVAGRILGNSDSLEHNGFSACMVPLESVMDGDRYTPLESTPLTHLLQFAVRVNKLANSSLASVVAHEGLHLVCDAFHNRGVPLSAECDEPFAYQLDSVVFRVMELFKSQSKRTINV